MNKLSGTPSNVVINLRFDQMLVVDELRVKTDFSCASYSGLHKLCQVAN